MKYQVYELTENLRDEPYTGQLMFTKRLTGVVDVSIGILTNLTSMRHGNRKKGCFMFEIVAYFVSLSSNLWTGYKLPDP